MVRQREPDQDRLDRLGMEPVFRVLAGEYRLRTVLCSPDVQQARIEAGIRVQLAVCLDAQMDIGEVHDLHGGKWLMSDGQWLRANG